jgi:hypothetical protein
MTNAEIRAAILRIVFIKSLKEEEVMLRSKVIREMKKRRKEKLDLGGPNKEDYVCLRSVDVKEIRPEALLTYFEDRAVDAGLKKESVLQTFLRCIQVKINRLREEIGRAEADHLRSSLKVNYLFSQEFLTYKISTDEKNQVRGIDL